MERRRGPPDQQIAFEQFVVTKLWGRSLDEFNRGKVTTTVSAIRKTSIRSLHLVVHSESYDRDLESKRLSMRRWDRIA
jgi:hypothetical protein